MSRGKGPTSSSPSAHFKDRSRFRRALITDQFAGIFIPTSLSTVFHRKHTGTLLWLGQTREPPKQPENWLTGHSCLWLNSKNKQFQLYKSNEPGLRSVPCRFMSISAKTAKRSSPCSNQPMRIRKKPSVPGVAPKRPNTSFPRLQPRSLENRLPICRNRQL